MSRANNNNIIFFISKSGDMKDAIMRMYKLDTISKKITFNNTGGNDIIYDIAETIETIDRYMKEHNTNAIELSDTLDIYSKNTIVSISIEKNDTSKLGFSVFFYIYIDGNINISIEPKNIEDMNIIETMILCKMVNDKIDIYNKDQLVMNSILEEQINNKEDNVECQE